jgi:hypothetical protein
MAQRTSKLIVCIDTYRNGEDPEDREIGVRVLDANTFRVMGEAEVGEWRAKDAVHHAIDDFFYERGGFRANP